MDKQSEIAAENTTRRTTKQARDALLARVQRKTEALCKSGPPPACFIDVISAINGLSGDAARAIEAGLSEGLL